MKISCYDCGKDGESKSMIGCRECKKASCDVCFVAFHGHDWKKDTYRNLEKMLKGIEHETG